MGVEALSIATTYTVFEPLLTLGSAPAATVRVVLLSIYVEEFPCKVASVEGGEVLII